MVEEAENVPVSEEAETDKTPKAIRQFPEDKNINKSTIKKLIKNLGGDVPKKETK